MAGRTFVNTRIYGYITGRLEAKQEWIELLILAMRVVGQK